MRFAAVLVKTFMLEKSVVIFFQHAEEDPCHVVLKPRRLEPMFKMADGAGEMCGRNLGFQPSKKTTKGQFFIFFMERYYCIRTALHGNRVESNFHSRRGRRVVVKNLYSERSKIGGPIMFRSFSHLG